MNQKDVKARKVMMFDQFAKSYEQAHKTVKSDKNPHPGMAPMKGENLFVRNDANPYKALGIPHDESHSDINPKHMNANQVDVFHGRKLTADEKKKVTDAFGHQVVTHHQMAFILDESISDEIKMAKLEEAISNLTPDDVAQFVNESELNETTIHIQNLSWQDQTRIIKWLGQQDYSRKDYKIIEKGKDIIIDTFGLEQFEIEEIKSYLKSQSYINESELFEGEINHQTDEFALVRIGGSIGSKGSYPVYAGGKMGTVIETSNDKEELKEKAKRMRKSLSPGERKYYGMNYTVIALTNFKRKEIEELIKLQTKSETDKIEESELFEGIGDEAITESEDEDKKEENKKPELTDEDYKKMYDGKKAFLNGDGAKITDEDGSALIKSDDNEMRTSWSNVHKIMTDKGGLFRTTAAPKKDEEDSKEKKKEKKKDEDSSESLTESKDSVDFTIPNWAVAALINGDETGLTDDEQKRLAEFVEDTVNDFGNANFMLPTDDELDLGFCTQNDIDGRIGGDCTKLLLIPSK